MEKSIELDCQPGAPRPDSFIKGIIHNTGLKLKEPVSKFFGNWKWCYDEVPDNTWKDIQPTLKKRIENLYNTGCIRFGSW